MGPSACPRRWAIRQPATEPSLPLLLELGLECLHALFHGLELLQQHLVRRLGCAVVAGEHRRAAQAEHQRSNQHCRRGAAHALSVYAAELPLEARRLTARRHKKCGRKQSRMDISKDSARLKAIEETRSSPRSASSHQLRSAIGLSFHHVNFGNAHRACTTQLRHLNHINAVPP